MARLDDRFVPTGPGVLPKDEVGRDDLSQLLAKEPPAVLDERETVRVGIDDDAEVGARLSDAARDAGDVRGQRLRVVREESVHVAVQDLHVVDAQTPRGRPGWRTRRRS